MGDHEQKGGHHHEDAVHEEQVTVVDVTELTDDASQIRIKLVPNDKLI